MAASNNVKEVIEQHVQLILSTRHNLHDSPQASQLLITAASNAISVLNYGRLCGLFGFQFYHFPDWRGIRIPNANLNMAVLSHCNFDNADMSGVSLFRVCTRGGSFRGANLRNATSYEYPQLVGHKGRLFCATFSNNGRYLATSNSDGTVRIWDLSHFECLHALKVRDTSVYRLVFSPDDLILATGGPMQKVRLWDVASGGCVAELGESRCLQLIQVLAFSADGCFIAASFDRGLIRVWDITRKYNLIVTLQVQENEVNQVLSISFSPDSLRLAAAYDGGKVIIWEVLSARRALEYATQSNPSRILFASNGCYVATWSSDSALVDIRDATNGECVKALTQLDSFAQLLRSSHNTYSMECSQRGLNIWRLVGHNPSNNISAFVPDFVPHAISPDGQLIAGRIGDSTSIHVYNSKIYEWTSYLASHRSEPRTELNTPKRRYGLSSRVFGLAFSPDCKTLASAHGDGWVRLWDISACTQIARLPCFARHLAFANQGATLVTGGNHFIYVWNLKTQKKVHLFVGPDRPKESPSQRCLSMSSRVEECVGTLHLGVEQRIAVSHSSHLLASCGHSDTPKLFDLEKGKLLCELVTETYCVRSLAFSSDDTLLAGINTRGELYVWRSDEAKLVLHAVPPPNEVRYFGNYPVVRFAPGGRTVATGGPDQFIRIWDLRSGEITSRLNGHSGSITDLLFSSDGRFLVSSSLDGLVRVWDVQTGSCKQTIADSAPVPCLSMSADNANLITTTADSGLLQVWRLHLDPTASEVKNHKGNVVSFQDVLSANTELDLCGDFEGATLDPRLLKLVTLHQKRLHSGYHDDSAEMNAYHLYYTETDGRETCWEDWNDEPNENCCLVRCEDGCQSRTE